MSQSTEPSVHCVGEYAGVRYGASYRVMPTSTLRAPHGTQVIAEILWDAEHPKPNLEEPAEDWSAARRRAIDSLAMDIAKCVPTELSVERIGAHAGVRYGISYRVLPISTLRTPRGAHVIAQILWDSEHPKRNLEAPVEDWNAARRRAINDLARDIARRLSTILDDDDHSA